MFIAIRWSLPAWPVPDKRDYDDEVLKFPLNRGYNEHRHRGEQRIQAVPFLLSFVQEVEKLIHLFYIKLVNLSNKYNLKLQRFACCSKRHVFFITTIPAILSVLPHALYLLYWLYLRITSLYVNWIPLESRSWCFLLTSFFIVGIEPEVPDGRANDVEL